MPKLFADINNDLKAAMRAKNELELSVLRMLISAIKNKKIELISKDDLSDEQIAAVVKTEIKKRKDSIEAYQTGNRPDLAEKEKAEIVFLEKYMPTQMGEAEIEKIVREIVAAMPAASPEKFGQIMGQAMTRARGQADGNTVSAVVKKVLAE